MQQKLNNTRNRKYVISNTQRELHLLSYVADGVFSVSSRKQYLHDYHLKNKDVINERTRKYQAQYRKKMQYLDFGLYKTFKKMKERCHSKSDKSYRFYGAKGIVVEWKTYQSFKKDMFKSYLKHLDKHGRIDTTIDRINPTKNYCKKNCRWATRKQQNARMHKFSGDNV